MIFNCPSCSKSLSTPDETAGNKVECPKCGQRILIPSPKNKTKLGQIVDESPSITPSVPPEKRGFRCIHCGSQRTPDSYIDSNSPENKSIMSMLVLLTMLSCCICFPILLFFPMLAWKSHRCAECGIKLGG